MDQNDFKNNFSYSTTLNFKNIFSQEYENVEKVSISINLTLVTIALLGCGTLIFITKMILRQKEKKNQLQNPEKNDRNKTSSVGTMTEEGGSQNTIENKKSEVVVANVPQKENKKTQTTDEILAAYKEWLSDPKKYKPLVLPMNDQNKTEHPTLELIKKHASYLYAVNFLVFSFDKLEKEGPQLIPRDVKNLKEKVSELFDNKEFLNKNDSVSEEFYDSFFKKTCINDQMLLLKNADDYSFEDVLSRFNIIKNTVQRAQFLGFSCGIKELLIAYQKSFIQHLNHFIANYLKK